MVGFKTLTRSALLLAAVSITAFAGPLTWTLENVTGPDGATFTGSFAYDADATTFSAIDITITPGPDQTNDYAPATTFLYVDAAAPVAEGALAAVDSNAGDLTGANVLALYPSAALTDAGGTVSISGGAGICFNSDCSGAYPYGEFYNLTGSVTASAATPEPSAFLLAGPALLLTLRRRFLR